MAFAEARTESMSLAISSSLTADMIQELPISTTTPTSKKLTLIPLIFLIYFEVAGGPSGAEPAVKAAGPLLTILGFLIFPFIWSIPEALVTAELSTAFPGNGGFVIWAHQAFGPFWGSLMGTWKFFSVVANIAAFPVMCMDYLDKLFSVFSSGLPRKLALVGFTLMCSFLNYTGLVIVGYTAVVVGVISLFPFILMSLISIPKIHPHRWVGLGQKGVKRYWNLYFNTLFWNLNFWDSVSTLAGEVENPNKTFPQALFSAVILTCFSYLIPLFATIGVVSVDQREWETGFFANAAAIVSGEWLQVSIEIGVVLSSIGLFEAQLSSCVYQLVGMADLGFLPRFFAVRSKWFDTPWVGTLLATVITVGASFMDFTDIVASANFLYSLGMLLEFASFLWLRRKLPALRRPYRVPMRLSRLIIACLIPSGFLILIMAIASKIVFLLCGMVTVFGIGMYFLMKLCKKKKWFKFSHEVQFYEQELQPM